MPRKQSNANLKNDLIKALGNLLKIEALDGLDVRKIAKEAGCSVGTFYNHYKSLDDLIIHYNGTTLDILAVCLFEGITSKDSAKDVINKICQNYISFAENNNPDWFLLLEYPLNIETPPWYRAKGEELFKKIAVIFHPILRGHKRDTEKAVKVLWSALHGIYSLTLKQRLRFKHKQNTLELCQDLFHNYILGFRIGVGIT